QRTGAGACGRPVRLRQSAQRRAGTQALHRGGLRAGVLAAAEPVRPPGGGVPVRLPHRLPDPAGGDARRVLPAVPAPQRLTGGPRGSVDAELLELVAQGAEGDAQRRRGAGLVVAVFLQRLLDRGALDFLDVGGQGAGSGVVGADPRRVGAGLSGGGRRRVGPRLVFGQPQVLG